MIRINRALYWFVLDVSPTKNRLITGGDSCLVPVIGSLPEVIQESLKN